MPFCASAGASRGANLATRTGGSPRTRVQVCVDLSSRHGGPWRRRCRPSVPSVRPGREPLAREDAARAPCACPFSCPSVCRCLVHSPLPRRVRRLSPKPGLGDSAPCTLGPAPWPPARSAHVQPSILHRVDPTPRLRVAQGVISGRLEAGSPSASYYRGQNCLDFCN